MSDSNGLDSTKYRSSRRQPQTQHDHQHPDNCPRCESTNTKFCYYNNYNKTQPRHFCKACKRYWTKGGTLRNVPIGGGGRKNKRLRCSSTVDSDDVVKNESLILQPSHSGSEKSDDRAESYTDIEELKGLVSWDYYGRSFIGCTMQQLGDHDDDCPRLGLFETNPISTSFIEILENDHDQDSIVTSTTSMIMPSSSSQQCQIPITNNLLELDSMLLGDLNKPWEDPTFKTE